MKTILLILGLSLLGCGSSVQQQIQGPKGDPGTNGTDGVTVTHWVTCTLGSVVGSNTITDSYLIITFSNNQRLVTCSVSTSVGEYSKTTWNNGISTCIVSATMSPDASGYWTFNESSGVYTASYTSSGANNGHVDTLTSGCTTIM